MDDTGEVGLQAANCDHCQRSHEDRKRSMMQLHSPRAGAAQPRAVPHQGRRGEWAMMKTEYYERSGHERKSFSNRYAGKATRSPTTTNTAINLGRRRGPSEQGAPRLRVGHTHLSKERQLMTTMCGVTAEPVTSGSINDRKRYKVCSYQR